MAGNRTSYGDESFGDFKVAAYPVNNAFNHQPANQMSAGVEVDDDDWGDFVDNSTQINGGPGLSNGFAHVQFLPQQYDSLKPFDPFGISVDRKEKQDSRVPDIGQLDSGPGSVNPVESRFLKPHGALPLSIFGEDEGMDEEQKSGEGESTFGGDANYFSNGNGSYGMKRCGLTNEIGINDLIANLYEQSTQPKVENGPDNIRGGSDLYTFGLKAAANGTVWGSSFQGLRDHELDLNSDKLILEVNENDDDEDDGWEFKSAETETLKEDGSYQGVAEISGHKELASGHAPSKSFDFSNWTSRGLDDWNLRFDSIPRARSQSNLAGESKLGEAGDGTTSANGTFWETKDPFSQPRSRNISEFSVLPDVRSSVVEAINVESEGPHSLNPFPESNKISSKSQGLDFGFDFKAGFHSLDGTAFDSIKIQQDEIVKGLSWLSIPADATIRTPEGSAAGTVEKPKENHANLNILREALPNSLFGTETSLVNGSLECQSTSTFGPAINSISAKTVGPNLSVNDLISTLYNQAEEKIPVNHTPAFQEIERDSFPSALDHHLAKGNHSFADDSWEFKEASTGSALYSQAVRNSVNDTPYPSDIGLQLSVLDNKSNFGYNTSWELKNAVPGTGSKLSNQTQWNFLNSSADAVGSGLINEVGDDFSDDPWEFKDASSGNPNNDETPGMGLYIPSSVVAIKLELSDCANLYSKLREELYSASLNHLENLKKAQTVAALSNGDTEAGTFDEEIKEFSIALSQCEMMSKECQYANQPPNPLNLDELVEMLKAPKYQPFESEYRLSSRLATAKKDFRSAAELLKHVTSTVWILNLKSKEEQSNYLAMWSKVVSVCSQELRHGAHIWKQSLVNHVNDLILSTHQGKQYFHALGEIFRVVRIIGASVKLYKPWLLLGSAETASLLGSLNECSVLWSNSGLEDAVKSAVILVQEKTQMGLLQSIKYIHNLDELALQSHFVCPTAHKCRLSALPLDLVPGLKTVEWDGETYFLSLANLWANLISPDPPKT